MKIILCIFLLNITAVSVFGQSVELNDIVGQSVKFPAAVEKGGFLMYGGDPIGESSLGTPGIGKYSGRVQWDKCTGLFSLSGLKMEDIGEYKVQNTDKNITVFQLNVYKDNVNVSKPHVIITQNEYPCTIECTAERGTEATLSWYREGQTTPYSRSSVRSAPHLDLPQTVERSGTYTCEAKNSVSNEKASITVGDHCTDPASSNTVTVVSSVFVAVFFVTLIAVLIYFLRCRFIRRRRGFERRHRALRTLIQVKDLLNNVDLHAYGDAVQAVPQSGIRRDIRALRTLIQVKKLLDYVDLHAYDETIPPDGNRSKQPTKDVKKLLDYVDLHAYAVQSLIPVKTLLDNLTPHAYVKDLLIDVDPYKSNESIPPDAVGTLIQVKELLDDVDPYEFIIKLLDDVDPDKYSKFIYHPEATEKMTSSHETEVPLKQVTCEVGEP